MPPERTYEIHEVAALTGLATARLRAWERRYEVVRPERQANGYRAYTAAQVSLLRACARLIAGGERIGDLVGQPPEDVIARAEGRDRAASAHAPILDAVRALDRERLERLVAQQIALRGLTDFAESVALPLAREIGELWQLGTLPIAAEHLASEVVVHAMKSGLRVARASGPLALFACLPGERHEWGVLATMARAQDAGWRVEYLGADLPIRELLEAAWTLRPGVVVLAGTDPEQVAALFRDLGAVPGRLPPGTVAAIGGAGAEPHARLLREFGFAAGPAAGQLMSAGPRAETEDKPKQASLA